MTRIQKKQLKEVLENIGFKRKGGEYVYNTKQAFSLHISFYDNQFIAAQMVIDSDYDIDMLSEELLTVVNFSPDNVSSLISTAKKAIKIVGSMNKRFEQLKSEIEKFNRLVI